MKIYQNQQENLKEIAERRIREAANQTKENQLEIKTKQNYAAQRVKLTQSGNLQRR